MNILHLNDLHLENPNGAKEALRIAFYPEYFESLIVDVTSRKNKIDCIFVTGDIVHKTAEDNYPHAKNIILYLSQAFSVSKEAVYIINGNHDVSRISGDMEAFRNFLKEFDESKNFLKKGERYKFYKEGENGILCLDSIGDSYKTGEPSALRSEIKDEIVQLIRQQAELKEIFVLSHHPPASYDVQNQAPFDEESPSWGGKHIWADGGNLHRRLSSRTTCNGNVYWFAGDIHRPEHCIINDFRVLLVTGSVNAIEGGNSHLPPQIRIVSTDDKYHSELYEYRFAGHNQKGLEGRWELKNIDGHLFNTCPKNSLPADLDKKEENIEISQPHLSQLFLVDEELERKLHKSIVEEKLYEFGRFDTNIQTTSLAWVSIHGLLKSYQVFSAVINAFRKIILSIIPNSCSERDCLIVGIDSWGSILASRLGAATNIRSCCVAVRSAGDSYDNVERINNNLKQIVKKKKIALVISDVISTGKSISTVRSELDCSECANWYNLTIFCDPSQERGNCFNGYEKSFYLCGTIKMPIIERFKLPENDILKANISFIQ